MIITIDPSPEGIERHRREAIEAHLAPGDHPDFETRRQRARARELAIYRYGLALVVDAVGRAQHHGRDLAVRLLDDEEGLG
jgi:hypothetical protein